MVLEFGVAFLDWTLYNEVIVRHRSFMLDRSCGRAVMIHRLPPALSGIPVVIAITLLVAGPAAGDEPASFDALAAEYVHAVSPLLGRFCLDCHSTEQQEADLDLESFATLAEVRQEPRVWVKVAEMLAHGEMPPEDAEQPAPGDHQQLRGWLQRYLHAEALANAGDPGRVLLRRLNHAEYTYTIRDLTGVELDPARQFPSEGAGGEGFTNAGTALAMSPGLLTKYLDAGSRSPRTRCLGLMVFDSRPTPRSTTGPTKSSPKFAMCMASLRRPSTWASAPKWAT